MKRDRSENQEMAGGGLHVRHGDAACVLGYYSVDENGVWSVVIASDAKSVREQDFRPVPIMGSKLSRLSAIHTLWKVRTTVDLTHLQTASDDPIQ